MSDVCKISHKRIEDISFWVIFSLWILIPFCVLLFIPVDHIGDRELRANLAYLWVFGSIAWACFVSWIFIPLIKLIQFLYIAIDYSRVQGKIIQLHEQSGYRGSKKVYAPPYVIYEFTTPDGRIYQGEECIKEQDYHDYKTSGDIYICMSNITPAQFRADWLLLLWRDPIFIFQVVGLILLLGALLYIR